MKVKSGYLLRSIAGGHIVLPLGARSAEFNGMITLNGTGAFLWKLLVKGAEEKELAQALVSNYEDVELPEAREAVREFLETLQQTGCLE